MKRLELNKQKIKALMEGQDGPAAAAVMRAAQTVERRAKQNAPFVTGRLRSSITKTLGRDMAGFVARVGTNVHYARWVEFGTRRMAPRAYLRRALDSIKTGGG